MDVKLPASGSALPLPKSSAEAGAIYRGLLVGVAGPKRRRQAALGHAGRTHAGASRSSCRTLRRGPTLRFWESDFETFSTVAARPGGPASPAAMPQRLTPRTPSGIAVVRVSG